MKALLLIFLLLFNSCVEARPAINRKGVVSAVIGSVLFIAGMTAKNNRTYFCTAGASFLTVGWVVNIGYKKKH